MRRRIVLAVAGVLAGAVACAKRPPVPPLEVRNPWARSADSAATTAAYFILVNHEAAAITLSGAESPLAESVTLHESMEMKGMVHMVALDAPQAIAPGDSLVVKEGGKHLMVTGLKRALANGDSLPLVLHFGDGRALRVTAIVHAP